MFGFICAFLVFSMTGCFATCSSPDIIVDYQIPFAKSGTRWNEFSLLDEDDYGRQLYSYKSEGYCTNVLSDYMGDDYVNSPVLVYIIAQKKDKEFVYCYDDLCYIYVKSFESDNSDAIDSLKEINDWNKPLNEEKMIALFTNLNSNGMSEYKLYSIEKEIVKTLEETVGYEIEDYYLDVIFLENAQPMFTLREVKKRADYGSGNEFGKSYVFYIPDNQSESIYLQLSDDVQNWNKEINSFKKLLNNQGNNQGTVSGQSGDG